MGVAETKARLSEVIDRATDAPQTITRHKLRVAVVFAAEGWERKTKRRGNPAEFFAASPPCGAVIDLGRMRDTCPRPVRESFVADPS